MRWAEVATRRVFRIVNGGTPKSEEQYWNGDVPWATPVDIGAVDGNYLVSTERTLTEKGVCAGSRAVPGGSLILSTRAPIGYIAQTRERIAFNQGCRGLIPAVPADVRYFRYYLYALRDELVSRGAGSTFMELSTDALAAVPVKCPPVDEQRRIADFLDAETARIDQMTVSRRAQVDTLGELWDSQLAAAIDEQARIHGWIALRRVVTSVEQGWSPQCDDVIAEPDEWAVLKTSAVSSGEFAPLEHKRLPADVEPDPRYQVLDGDVLLTRGSGSPDRVGMVAEAQTEGRLLLLSDLLYRIRLGCDWSPEFVALALRSQPVRGLMGLLLRGQSGQTIKLRAEDIRSIEIPAVPAAFQKRIATELSAERATIRNASQSIETSLSLLAERRQALITTAVTGGIDATTAQRGAVL